jgi:hypothetical protein
MLKTDREVAPKDRNPWRPKFMREIRERVEAVGVTQGVHEVLTRDNITISVKGDYDRLKTHVANQEAISHVAGYLGAGGAVNIFPCGSIVDATTHPWRQGVGRIIQQIPDEKKGDVLVVPYRMPDASWPRLVGAIAFRGRGIAGHPQSLDVELGPIHTAAEVVQATPNPEPTAITQHLRHEFVSYFGEANVY